MIKTFSLILDLLEVCLCVKLESSVLQDLLCKSAKLDWSRIRLDRSKLVKIVFSANFPTQVQAYLTCRVLCFAFSIKGKTLAMFYYCCLCCVYESLVRSSDVCFHTYLGFQSQDWCRKLGDCFGFWIKSLKIYKRECLCLLWIQERSSLWTRSCHMVVVISFLLKVAIGY